MFNKKVICVILIIILSFVFYMNFSTYAENNQINPVATHGKLKVDGTDIIDKNGNKFQLRGVSSHGIAWFPQYINQEAFNYMKNNWKINTIRLAMYSDPGAGYNTSLHEKVKQGVEYASNAGLYAIIDWHILNDNNPNIHKNEAINFFKEMANSYKDYDNVIYEICNEPNGNVKWNEDIKPYAEDVINEIRKIDNDALIIVGTPTWSQDVDIVSNSPITGQNNIMYALHFYADTHRDNLRDKLKTALNNRLPVFVSEFGICDASGNGNINKEEANKWISLLNEKNISYMCWNLSNKNESSALLKDSTYKITDWSNDELSEEGKWLVDTLNKYPDEIIENINDNVNKNINNLNDNKELNTTNQIQEINNNNNNKSNDTLLYIIIIVGVIIAIELFVLILIKKNKK